MDTRSILSVVTLLWCAAAAAPADFSGPFLSATGTRCSPKTASPPCLAPAPDHRAPTSGEAIVKAMRDRYAKTWYHTLTFAQTTEQRTAADTMTTKQTWKEVMLLPGRLWVDIERPTGDVFAMYLGDSLFLWNKDSVLSRAASRNIFLIMGFDVYEQPVAKTLAVLAEEHYPMSPVREDTWQGRPVYVIGAPAGDTHSHQLWIDKDRLLFLRAIEPSSNDSTKSLDYRFAGYVQVPGGWVAEHVELYLGDKLVQREEYYDVRTNVPVDSSLFQAPHGH